MTRFQDLPQEAVGCISEHLHPFPPYDSATQRFDFDDFKSALAFSHLCTSTRTALHERLMSIVIFERRETHPNAEETRTDGSYGAASERMIRRIKQRPSLFHWNSNIDLVARNGTAEITTMIILSRDEYIEPAEIIKGLRLYLVDSFSWDSVTMLRVYEGNDSTFSLKIMDETRRGTLKQEDVQWVTNESLVELADYIANCLPNLTDIESHDVQGQRLGKRHTFSPLLGKLAKQWRRIRAISGNVPVFNVDKLSAELTHLHLGIGNAVDILTVPKLYAPALEHLRLDRIALDSLWRVFYGHTADSCGGGFSTITFAMLKSLYLDFSVPMRPNSQSVQAASGLGSEKRKSHSPLVDDTDYIKYRVLSPERAKPSFPKLDSLTLSRYPSKIGELLDDLPCHQIKSLVVSGCQPCLNTLHLSRFTSLQRATISDYTNVSKSREVPHAQRLLDRVFGITSGLRKLVLYIRTSHMDKHSVHIRLRVPEQILCTHVRELIIEIGINSTMIKAIIRQLPYLERLTVTGLVLEDMSLPTSVTTDPRYTGSGLPPVVQNLLFSAAAIFEKGIDCASTSLMELSLNGLYSQDPTTIFYTMLTIATCVPSLEKVTISAGDGCYYHDLATLVFKSPMATSSHRFLEHIKINV